MESCELSLARLLPALQMMLKKRDEVKSPLVLPSKVERGILKHATSPKPCDVELMFVLANLRPAIIKHSINLRFVVMKELLCFCFIKNYETVLNHYFKSVAMRSFLSSLIMNRFSAGSCA